MGLIVNVFTNRRWFKQGIDCTARGWSSIYDEVCVTNAEGPFEPTLERPAVRIVAHRTLKGAIHAVLENHFLDCEQTMAGGNYLACSDSRLWELCERLGASRFHGAISIHDRIER